MERDFDTIVSNFRLTVFILIFLLIAQLGALVLIIWWLYEFYKLIDTII